MSTSIQRVGLQVWRASLLMADLVVATASEFRNRTVVELGCGSGLSSLALAQVAENCAVIATDHDHAVLQLARRNVENNSHSFLEGTSIAVRELDWWCAGSSTEDDLGGDDDAADGGRRFRWKERYFEKNVPCLLAADTIYSAPLADAFLRQVEQLVLDTRCRRCVLLLALEKRFTFSKQNMGVVSVGYDRFRSRVEECRGPSPLFASEEGLDLDLSSHTRAEGPQWRAHQIAVDTIPHSFQYERTDELEVWRVEVVT